MTTPEEQRLPTDVPATSQLFTVRIWVEPEGQCKHGWRGKVHHISSGAWRYVRIIGTDSSHSSKHSYPTRIFHRSNRPVFIRLYTD
ncbi:MAG: hypothetical protein R2932_21920 [Caldilineaceae bacterium]